MKRRYVFLVGCLLLILSGAGFYAFQPNTLSEPSSVKLEKSAPAALALSGFQSGAPVTYSVISGENETKVLRAVTDESGAVKIPYSSDLKARAESALTYVLRVDQSDQPVDLRLELDTDQNKLKVSGSAAQNEFSNILIETAHGKDVIGQSQTKTDWAGFFSEESLPLSSADKAPADTYKVVMYDHIENDASELQPLTIKVFSAPGGGRRTAQGVNEFMNLYCESEPVELSVCDDDRLKDNNETIVTNYVFAFASMAEQLSAVMMQQIGIIGTFFDATQQIETARGLQALQAEAVKDYQPSEQMCHFGSFMKTIAKTEEKARLDTLAINSALNTAYANQGDSSSAEGPGSDLPTRIAQFSEKYCDITDNNNGLGVLCAHDDGVGAKEPSRKNKDIDYTRTFDYPLTLSVDFTDDAYNEQEEDVIALARNLYWPTPLSSVDKDKIAKSFIGYMDARQVRAIHNVAHNSFAQIAGLKSQTPLHEESNNGPAFMKALLKDLGVEDVDALLGERPSYYAQMEVLTKKIYQSPDFYTNLYTKPANIDRIEASLQAIQLMQNRDAFDSSLRREMLTSLMVEEALARQAAKVN